MKFNAIEVLNRIPNDAKVNTSKIKNYMLSLNNWESYVPNRHIKFLDTFKEEWDLQVVAKKFNYSMSEITQVFLRIQAELEMSMEYIKEKAEKNGIEDIRIGLSELTSIDKTAFKNKAMYNKEKLIKLVKLIPDWRNYIGDFKKIRCVELILNDISQEVIAKTLDIKVDTVYDKVYRNKKGSVFNILESVLNEKIKNIA